MPVNKEAISQVQHILSTQFTGLSEEEIAKLPSHLRDPLTYRFHTILFVADDQHGKVKGFAILQHAADLTLAGAQKDFPVVSDGILEVFCGRTT